jgi:hypothetical protein
MKSFPSRGSSHLALSLFPRIGDVVEGSTLIGDVGD